VKESELQKLILDWLALHRIFHWRNNSGAFSVAGTDKWKRRYVRYGSIGSPDIFAIRKNFDINRMMPFTELFGIEVKGPKGALSDKQIAFAESFCQAGGRYILARSLEDVTRALS
jgi:hypothetical protein